MFTLLLSSFYAPKTSELRTKKLSSCSSSSSELIGFSSALSSTFDLLTI